VLAVAVVVVVGDGRSSVDTKGETNKICCENGAQSGAGQSSTGRHTSGHASMAKARRSGVLEVKGVVQIGNIAGWLYPRRIELRAVGALATDTQDEVFCQRGARWEHHPTRKGSLGVAGSEEECSQRMQDNMICRSALRRNHT